MVIKQKKAILLAVAIAVVLVGGAGAWFLAPGFFHGREEAAQGEEKKEKAEEKAEAKAEVSADMEPFVVNLAGQGPGRYVRTALSLSLRQKHDKERIKELSARIRHALIMLLSSKRAEDLLKLEGKTELREEIVKEINDAAGGEIVEAIYFREFLIQ